MCYWIVNLVHKVNGRVFPLLRFTTIKKLIGLQYCKATLFILENQDGHLAC